MKHPLLRSLTAILLSGIMTLSCAVIGAGAVPLTETEPPGQTEAPSNGSVIYAALRSADIPNGRYAIMNPDAKAVMPDVISSMNTSIATYKIGKNDDVLTDITIPDSCFYTFTSAGNGAYYVQNQRGEYLTIQRVGCFQFVSTPSTLTITPVVEDSVMHFNIFDPNTPKGSLSISMYESEWFTPHQTSLSMRSQLQRLYACVQSQESADAADQIEGLLDPGDPSAMTLAEGVTADTVRDLSARASSLYLSARSEMLLTRALSIVGGTAEPFTGYQEVELPRNGRNRDLADRINKPMFSTERYPTGLWATPETILHVYVEAGADDPLPSLMFTQHISYFYEKAEVQLHRGWNAVIVPDVHPYSFSTYANPDIEPGGMIYVINPYTKLEQSEQTRLFIAGADQALTFRKGEDTASFLNRLKDYHQHYQNGDKGYHNILECRSDFGYFEFTVTRAYQGYIQEGLDPNDTFDKWDTLIRGMFAFDGTSPEQYQGLQCGLRVLQSDSANTAAFSVYELLGIFDNFWLCSFLYGRYGWGFPHELGHMMDDQTRAWSELTNNMWSMWYVLSNRMYDQFGVTKDRPKYDMRKIASDPPSMTWDDTNSTAEFPWQLFLLWDLEVYHSGYWNELCTMFRNKSCGDSRIDNYLSNCSMKEKIAAYSSKIVGIDLTYYFERYGYMSSETNNYLTALGMMELRTDQPKIWHYKTDSYLSEKISNLNKGGQITLSKYNTSNNSFYINLPSQFIEGHLGFEIVKNGKIVDFIFNNEYLDAESGAVYTINAYDTTLTCYSSLTFTAGNAADSQKAAASVSGISYGTLNEAINAAPDQGTVELLGTCYLSSPVVLNKHITLKPADSSKQITIVNKVWNAPGFEIKEGGSLTVCSFDGCPDQSVVFDNDFAYMSNTGMLANPYFLVSGGSLELKKGVTVRNCVTRRSGSAVKAAGGTVRLTGCIIERNKAAEGAAVFLSEGAALISSGGTVLRGNISSQGGVIDSASPSDRIVITDTEICYNASGQQDGASVGFDGASVSIGSGTSIFGNGDPYYSTCSAMQITEASDVTFTGELHITDNVTVLGCAKVDPSITGELHLRPHRDSAGEGFVLARPTSGSFTASTAQAILFSHSGYHLVTNGDSLSISAASPLTNTSQLSANTITLGESVTVNCSASGGTKPYQFAVYYRKASTSSYTVVQNYDTNKTVTITPSAAVDYDIMVKVKDGNGKIVKQNYTLSVQPGALALSAKLSANTIRFGESVTVNCSATGGTKPYQFAVYYRKASTSSYTVVQNYDANKTVTITPSSAVDYDIMVKVKDGSGKIVKQNYTLSVQPGALALSAKLSANTIRFGESVTVNCSASGGTKPYQFAVYYKKSSTSSYTVVQNYDANKTVTITPSSAVDYDIMVKVKDGNGKIVKQEYTLSVQPGTLALSAKLSANTIRFGESVTVTCSASGGTKPYQFAVYYKKSSTSSYTVVQNYGTNKTVTITPSSAVDYDIMVKVKDGNGKIVKQNYTLSVQPGALALSAKLSANTIRFGESVTVTCSASGGTKPYQFAVYYKKASTSSYTVVQNYDANKTVTITPSSAVDYDIMVKVKDGNGKIVKQEYTLSVQPGALALSAKLSSKVIRFGESVTVTCSASGGTKPYQFAVYYKKASTSSYTVVQNYDANKTVTITPSAAVGYDIKVKVRDSGGTIAVKTLSLTVVR